MLEARPAWPRRSVDGMFATLFAVVVALVLGHLAPPSSVALRRYAWFSSWVHWLQRRLHRRLWQGRHGGWWLILPPTLAAALASLLLARGGWSLPALLFGTAVLYYAWGPRDLDLDVQAVLEADGVVGRRAAVTRLCDDGPPAAVSALDAPTLAGSVFDSARSRWFGVLFWFCALGPAGALCYRLLRLAGQEAALPAANRAGSVRLRRWLDWPVSQLMAASLALVGNFGSVCAAWRAHGGAGFDPNAEFLAATGRACVLRELDEQAREEQMEGAPAAMSADDLPELRDAMSLIWRMLALWLAVLASFVLAGWLA